MEVSAMPPMPLDFSMVRNGGGSPGNGLRESSPRPMSTSAFRVVTPKGKKPFFLDTYLDFRVKKKLNC